MPVRDGDDAPRERLTVKLPGDLIDRLRNAVYYTDGITMTSVVEDSIRGYIDALEEGRGQRFPRRKGALRPGRPRRSG